jgi:hypothetical protein
MLMLEVGHDNVLCAFEARSEYDGGLDMRKVAHPTINLSSSFFASASSLDEIVD